MNLFKRIVRRVRATVDAGMTTAEYAVGTVAAVGVSTARWRPFKTDNCPASLASMDRILAQPVAARHWSVLGECIAGYRLIVPGRLVCPSATAEYAIG